MNLPSETLLIYRHLHRDVWQLIVSIALGVGLDSCDLLSVLFKCALLEDWLTGVIFRVSQTHASWEKELENAAHDNNEEELDIC
jgi:hypothetical protein